MDPVFGGWSRRVFPCHGEWSETMVATQEIQKICVQVKPKVEEWTNKRYMVFTAIIYRKKMNVNGQDFLIKVHVGGENYIHLWVFQAFPFNIEKVELLGVQQHKTKDDRLEPF